MHICLFPKQSTPRPSYRLWYSCMIESKLIGIMNNHKHGKKSRIISVGNVNPMMAHPSPPLKRVFLGRLTTSSCRYWSMNGRVNGKHSYPIYARLLFITSFQLKIILICWMWFFNKFLSKNHIYLLQTKESNCMSKLRFTSSPYRNYSSSTWTYKSIEINHWFGMFSLP